jgi:hypothetical protein
MPKIDELSSIDSLAAGDLYPLYDVSNSDTRKVTLSVIQDWMQDNLTFPTFTGFIDYASQYFAPSATGFSVAITDSSVNTHLILTPAAGYATGTIILPSLGNAIDKQRVLVNSTQQVTTLTVSGNGASVSGAPTSLGASDFFEMKFDSITSTWYRVG